MGHSGVKRTHTQVHTHRVKERDYCAVDIQTEKMTDTYTNLIVSFLQSLILQYQVLSFLHKFIDLLVRLSILLQLRHAIFQPRNVLFKRLSVSPHVAPIAPQNKVVEKEVDYHRFQVLQLPRVEIDRQKFLQFAPGSSRVRNFDDLRSRRLRDLAAHLL